MDLKIFTNNIEDKAREQVYTLLDQDAFRDAKVRIMPDVHAGAGCVIGFTADLGNKVIPNIVGVDIGCGVRCSRLGKIDIDLEELDKIIKSNIPSGLNVHDKPIANAADYIDNLRCKDQLKNRDWLENSLGTLGGGNHFIEIDEDEEGIKYLVIHTGSRNLGKQVADIYQQKAIDNLHTVPFNNMRKELITSLKEQGREKEIQNQLKEFDKKYSTMFKLPKDLCYLEGQDREDYLHDMKICQEFAVMNRFTISFIIELALKIIPEYSFESVHNYISKDNMVRKGAISAHKEQPVIIPLNMRDGCIIGTGKGNEDWNCSAPHGAGRLMSRMEARRTLKLEDFKCVMEGIYTTTVNEDTIDEAPMVYKNAQEIIDNIKDTVDIVKLIKPIYNFKAGE